MRKFINLEVSYILRTISQRCFRKLNTELKMSNFSALSVLLWAELSNCLYSHSLESNISINSNKAMNVPVLPTPVEPWTRILTAPFFVSSVLNSFLIRLITVLDVAGTSSFGQPLY